MKHRFALAVLVLAAALPLASFSPVFADEEHHDADGTYLAVGDSYAYAFNPTLDLTNAANFVGYSDLVARSLDLNLTNAACPGETSGSMISGTTPDNGCHANYPPLPLHISPVTYSASLSQLDFAVNFLKTHHRTRLVTVQIGGNDFLVLLGLCGMTNPACIAAHIGAVEQQLATNLATIYTALRVGAHYHGAIVAVPYFAFNYNDPNSVGLTLALDGVESAAAAPFHVKVADAFDAFKAASAPSGIPCLAGLQVPRSSGCDIHPSLAGHAVFAAAILAALDEDSGEHDD